MFKDKIRFIDIKSIISFVIVFPISTILKIKKKNIWIVSERPHEARDNGYWFYKYAREERKNNNIYYVIDKKSPDYKKISNLGNIIQFGSIKHYLYYLSASIHISAHIDGGMPNRRVCDFLERNRILKNKKVFLQHGITKDKISFGYYKDNRVNLFVCAAKPEYEFVKNEFGYPKGAVQLLGFARFDSLYNDSSKNQILLMPTWRAWLAKDKNISLDKAKERFLESEYFNKYNDLISNNDLINLLDKNNIKLIFYLHSDMQIFSDLFKVNSDNIIIANSRDYDVQDLLKKSKLLITDYSSVAFDFAYMNKPIVYYQFDYTKYRQGQHAEGYYNYEKHGFGPVYSYSYEVIKYIKNLIDIGFTLPYEYKCRVNNFFNFRDKENCKRIYNYILNIK